ncbi:hypothetical protein C1646_752408 [Rhizophagus diaphanus]|nr:hypothetical protein C1646_752408 [Rhizophagus diaphanus] [Rhizophagus sp. MUCL 43196]
MVEREYTLASDIYSIATLMWEISSGQPATPLEYRNLMEQCWDANPSERPDIDRLYNKICEMSNLYYQDGSNKLYNEPFHKYNINLYQFFQSNKSKSFKANYGSRLITSKIYNFEHLSSLKLKNATESTKSYSLCGLLYLKTTLVRIVESECSSGVYISRTYSFEILDDIDNISSKDLTDSSRMNGITTEENDYVDLINSEDQDELEISDDK